jgi:hypothetical protein
MFLAGKEVIKYCDTLREKRDIDLIGELPDRTRSHYRIHLHKPDVYITRQRSSF